MIVNSVSSIHFIEAAAGLVGGIAVGVWHFASLRWNTRLFSAGRAVPAFCLQLARFALTCAVLFGLARIGAFALLAGMAGFLFARGVALHSVGKLDGGRR